MLKKSIISFAMIGAVALALASSGGGNGKKSEAPRKSAFTPIRTTNGFTLKAGSQHYAGSHIFSAERNNRYITYNTVVTYEKGNSVIILPHQARVTTASNYRSNLRLLDIKFRLGK